MDSVSAIMLLSGGLDSVTALAWAQREGFTIVQALSFTYGQRHAREVIAAASIARHYGIDHELVELTPISGSSLTDRGTIPQGRNLHALSETVAPTYVPNRNMILIAYAAARALLTDATHIIGGWNATDALNYPDCRESFLAATQETLRQATERDFTIVRPLILDTKSTIIRRALTFGAPIDLTWTCYMGSEYGCGTCDACQLRVGAFQHVGLIDPMPYALAIDWSGCTSFGCS